MPLAVPPRLRSHSVQPEVKSWRGSWGATLFGWARHCSDAMTTEQVGKAVGYFTVRLGKTSVAKRHAFKKRTVFTTRRRTHFCAPNAHSDTRALRRSGFKNKCVTTVKETQLFCVYRLLVSWCKSRPHAQVETEYPKFER